MKTSHEIQRRHFESIVERRSPFHGAVSAFARPKVDFILGSIGESAPGNGARHTLLEVGAGNGFFSVELSRVFDVTCVDFSPNMLDRNPLPRERKVIGMAEELPFSDASFDVVFSANLLHHLPDPSLAVREMRRAARAHVVLIEPNATNPLMFAFGALKKAEWGTLKFTPAYLKRLGIDAGLSLRRFSPQGFVLPNKTPAAAVSLARAVDRHHPLGFYLVAVFDK